MAPAQPPSCPEPELSDADRSTLLETARRAIDAAARSHPLERPEPERFAEPLRRHRACFVTLEQDDDLRGCIGTLKARQPLVVEVAVMARAAAVEDPRFAPVSSDELGRLTLSISVLSPPSPMTFSSEEDLLGQLRPGVDGLILREGMSSGTFLPSVWEKLPGPREFLQQLKRKAGLGPSHWSPTLRVERYTTESFFGPWWS
jgi:AmmeMemoRadiSam system protein A